MQKKTIRAKEVSSFSDLEDHSLNKSMSNQIKIEPILCIHCKRTKSNGIGCCGKCVADDEY